MSHYFNRVVGMLVTTLAAASLLTAPAQAADHYTAKLQPLNADKIGTGLASEKWRAPGSINSGKEGMVRKREAKDLQKNSNRKPSDWQRKAAGGDARSPTIWALANRVIIVHGVAQDTKLPDTVKSLPGVPAQMTLPVACGAIETN